MKKLYSTPNLVKAVSLGAAMATLLSSVSPVFAANLSIRGSLVQSTTGAGVVYAQGSHGSIVFAGDDDYCGVDNVIGRGGEQQQKDVADNRRIPVKEQYERFINGYNAPGGNPYGTTTTKVTWISDGTLTQGAAYMGKASTDGSMNVVPEAYGVYSFATGCGSSATGNYSTAFGAGATAKTGGSQAFGVSALASGKATVAIGIGSEASGEAAVAFGGLATASGISTVALGEEARAEKEYAIAIGARAEAKASGSIAIGGVKSERTSEASPKRKAIAEAENAIAIGSHTYAKLDDTVAIGANAQALVRDGVAVGGGSVSLTDKGALGYDPATGKLTTKTDATWKSTAGAFSVGEVGGSGNGTLTRQITGVAAGTEDTDAVNVAQLKAITAAASGAWKLSANDADPTDVNPGSTIDFSVKSKNDEGKDNLKIAKKVEGTKHKINFTLSDTLKLTSVTTGQSIMSGDGFAFDGEQGPRMTIDGIDAGNEKITGVADGDEGNDAVNYKQLKEVRTLAEKGWKLSVDGNNSTVVRAGGTVDLVAGETGDGSKNIKIAKDNDNKVTFSLNDALKLTSVTTGNSIMSDEGFKFIDSNGPSITLNGIDAGNKKITSVADAKDDTDAVNYKQLKDVKTLAKNGWKLSVDGNNSTDVKAGSTVDLVAGESEGGNKNIKITKDNDNKVTFSLNDTLKLTSVTTGNSIMSDDGFKFVDGGPSITAGGIHADNKKITGVAKGESGTDAVNFSQLQEIKDQIAGNSLVKWDEEQKLITIGAEKAGVEINVSNSKGETRVIAGVKPGKISHNSTEAINGDQLLSITETIADFFGGEETDIYNGIKPTFTVQKTKHNNVTDAFAAVDSSITNIDNKISNMIENSLVKWDEEKELITIGKEKSGTKINIAGTEGDRTIAGVKNGKISEDSKEAVNGSQISTISGDIAKFFGGDAAFQDGAFVGPQYNVSTVSTDGEVVQYIAKNVGDALTKLDANVKNVNSRIKYVDNKFDKFSQDALLWDDGKQAFAARHEKDGRKTDSKIIHLLNGDISEDSTDAINGSQIHSMGSDIAKFFGGGTEFNNGNFSGPTYVLSHVSANGDVVRKEHTDVGSALTGLDANVKNVNTRLTYFSNEFGNKFDQLFQDALLWSEENKAFVARHKEGNETIDSKIKFLADGDVSGDSTDAINGSQLHKVGDKIANYFGGGARYEDGEWSDPTFKVAQRKEDGTIVDKTHNNVADAFEDVDNSITDIYNQINNVTENSLVKQEGGASGVITIGKATGGTKISIVNKDGEERTLSGVKDGELSQTSTEAVNGSQLFATNEKVTTVTDNLKKVAENTSKYFGGSTDVLEGVEPAFLIQGTSYDNVTEAFTGVNTSITNIDNKISDVIKNSLVKQEGGASGVITIGKETAGTEINIAGYGGLGRKVSGVQAAEKGDEAVNKDQLDKSINDITKNIEAVTAAAVLYDKDEGGNVNYGSVTLGGKNNVGPVALLNVKDGDISEESTDAINGGQINTIAGDIANYFGGDASFENGAFKGPKYSLSVILEDGQVGKANYHDVGSALKGLDGNIQGVNNRLTNVSNEFNQKIEGITKDALLWSDDEQAFVALHGEDGSKTNSKLKFLLDGDISKGSTDAITGNQLFLMSNQLAAYFGGGAKYENGQWTAPNFQIAQVDADGKIGEKKNYNNVAEAFDGINNGMSNINNRIDDVINKVDSDALKWNEEKGAYDAERDGKPSKITGVANGKVEKDSKDAVNGGQLWETNERITGVEKDVKHLDNRVNNISNTIADIGDTVLNIDARVDNIDNKVNDIAEDAVRYDRDENGKKTNKITLVGGNPSEPVTIDKVADGKIASGSQQAVNGGQLHDYTKEQMKIILDESKNYTDQRVNNIVIDAIDDAVERANNYTNMKFEALNYSIENVRKEARQAAAIGLAVSNLRYNDTPGKLSVGFGSGLWRSQSAFAFGAGYTSEKGNIRSNISVTTSGGHWGVGAGFNMTLN